jgi:hypothetical protein
MEKLRTLKTFHGNCVDNSTVSDEAQQRALCENEGSG